MRIFLQITTLLSMSFFSFGAFAHDELGGHLSYKKDQLHIHAQFKNPPSIGSESILLLETREASTHNLIEIQDQIKVVLWMPSMGHGSSPTRIEPATDINGNKIIGKYIVRKVFFIMDGDWEVRIELKDSLGRTETQSFNIMIGENSSGHAIHH